MKRRPSAAPGPAAACGGLLLPLLALVLGFPAAAIEQRLVAQLSLRGLLVDGDRSFLDGGLGKLRLGEEDVPLALGSLLIEYRARLTPTLAARAVASAYDRVDRAVDLNEAYLEWRPVPRSAWRLLARSGAFHAPFSLENTGPAWTSPYTLSSSAINTWLGEELRTIGLELQVTRRGAPSGSAHDFGLLLGGFQANDPAGALLAWRGWALHDRQTRLFERLPLAPLPIFTESSLPQGPFEEPFKELDGRAGWYAGLQWDLLERSRLRLHRYDNNGDPSVAEDGQWAWDTRFDQLAWHLRLPARLELLAQALRGETLMTGFSGPLVWAEMEAAYLLVTGARGHQRLSLRHDRFVVADRDSFPRDPNQERGHAWTVAWFLDGPRSAGAERRWHWRIGVEAQQVDSARAARRLLGDPQRRREGSVQLVGEWRLR